MLLAADSLPPLHLSTFLWVWKESFPGTSLLSLPPRIKQKKHNLYTMFAANLIVKWASDSYLKTVTEINVNNLST